MVELRSDGLIEYPLVDLRHGGGFAGINLRSGWNCLFLLLLFLIPALSFIVLSFQAYEVRLASFSQPDSSDAKLGQELPV